MNGFLSRVPSVIITLGVVIVGGFAVHYHDLSWGDYVLALGIGGGGLGIGYGIDAGSRP